MGIVMPRDLIRGRWLSRIMVSAALLIIVPACGTILQQLAGPPAGRHPVPPRTQSLCSPIFRAADIETIIVSILASKDEGTTKSAALIIADTACDDSAANLLSIAQDEDSTFEFSALDASAFRDDCLNCYASIIDGIYD